MARRDAAQAPRGAIKVLNNNVVVAVDPQGGERVLMGRGLAFGLRPGGDIDPAKVEKTFILAQGEQGERERQILASAPYAVVEAVSAAVDDAERFLGRRLGRRLVLAVIDHVQFALERLKDAVRIPTAMPEIRVLYPKESAAAARMTDSIGAALGVVLPEEETVFLTMHLLNVTRGMPDGATTLLFRRVRHVVATVETELGVTLDPDSADYARFVIHVQFLLQRLVNDAMLRNSDVSFLEFTKHTYPRSYAIARQVKTYVVGATGTELTDEELMYVTVHVERLAQQVSGGGQDTRC
ncbi:PRD domain-containing protein [Xylanimonas allomyrinae]|uniref:PRD domain-containing protein n=1 Tax=Xylanimonas allomyrinae TaxID=2509459 RepID=A0A4P6EN22_9MICO|nr:PRD domain-containing protein [Xylanimonas allomyrinae]QAY63865.1 PRD domain-containing protein [Xylanimonas allomyrinae]